MCLIIASPKGILPEDELLTIAHNDNPHGWGVMWAEGGVIRVVKGFKLESLLRNVKSHEGVPFVVHLRFATSGDVDTANTHPFRITNDMWMAHNGILDIDEPRKDRSDTWHLAEELKTILRDFPWLKGDAMRGRLMRYVEMCCGRSNKIVFLKSDGEILIANEKLGTEHKGLWLSNNYSLPDNRAWLEYYCECIHPVPEPSKRISNFVMDGEAIETTTPYECDYCTATFNNLFGFEGQLVCFDCLEWLRRENDIYDNEYPGPSRRALVEDPDMVPF